MMRRADAGHIVNTSSVNGFWAFIAPDIPQTAYAAAKFAVKGFTEALITDLRLNAPHIKCSVVMPGHIGTSIAVQLAQGADRQPGRGDHRSRDRTGAPQRLAARTDDRQGLRRGDPQDDPRTGAALPRRRADDGAQAATIILDGVRNERWRILVGRDAELIDELVRATPEKAYEPEFFADFAAKVGWTVGR